MPLSEEKLDNVILIWEAEHWQSGNLNFFSNLVITFYSYSEVGVANQLFARVKWRIEFYVIKRKSTLRVAFWNWILTSWGKLSSVIFGLNLFHFKIKNPKGGLSIQGQYVWMTRAQVGKYLSYLDGLQIFNDIWLTLSPSSDKLTFFSLLEKYFWLENVLLKCKPHLIAGWPRDLFVFHWLK